MRLWPWCPRREASPGTVRAQAILVRATELADATEQHERDMRPTHVTIERLHRRNGITEMLLRTLEG